MPITPNEYKSFTRIDKLRDALNEIENTLTHLKRKDVSVEQLQEMFLIADLLEENFKSLSKLGIPCSSEHGRYSTILIKIENNAKQIVALFGGKTAYLKIRNQVEGCEENPWWRLDEVIAEKQKKKILRFSIISIIFIILGTVGYKAYQEFLAPDPSYIAMYGHQTSMNELMNDGKYEEALIEAEICIKLMPDMVELTIAKAALLEELGDTTSSEIFYDFALRLMDPYDFHSERSIFYLRMNNIERLEWDANYLMENYPSRANGFYFAGLSAENSGNKPAAIEYYTLAYEKAEAYGNYEQAAMIKIRLATLMQSF